MSSTFRHEDARAALALGALSEAEQDAVLAHVAECAECTQELAALSDAAAELASLVPTMALDPAERNAVRARLLARAAADARARVARSTPRLVLAGVERLARSGWLVAATLAAVLLGHHGFHQPLGGGWVVASALALALVATWTYVARLRQHLGEQDRAAPPPPPAE